MLWLHTRTIQSHGNSAWHQAETGAATEQSPALRRTSSWSTLLSLLISLASLKSSCMLLDCRLIPAPNPLRAAEAVCCFVTATARWECASSPQHCLLQVGSGRACWSGCHSQAGRCFGGSSRTASGKQDSVSCRQKEAYMCDEWENRSMQAFASGSCCWFCTGDTWVQLKRIWGLVLKSRTGTRRLEHEDSKSVVLRSSNWCFSLHAEHRLCCCAPQIHASAFMTAQVVLCSSIWCFSLHENSGCVIVLLKLIFRCSCWSQVVSMCSSSQCLSLHDEPSTCHVWGSKYGGTACL